MPTATVQVRHTTTTSTTRASVLVINTGYLSSRLGLLKFLILIFALLAFIMTILEIDHYTRYFYNSDRYLLLISFADWLAVALMLIAALISLGTASILPKTSFDFMFHFIMGILMIIGGLWVAIGAFDSRYKRSTYIQSGCILAMLAGIIQIVHGVFSYRLCITN